MNMNITLHNTEHKLQTKLHLPHKRTKKLK